MENLRAIEGRREITLYKVLIYTFATIGVISMLSVLLFFSFIWPEFRKLQVHTTEEMTKKRNQVYMVMMDGWRPVEIEIHDIFSLYKVLYDSLASDSNFLFDSKIPQHGFILNRAPGLGDEVFVFNAHCGCATKNVFDVYFIPVVYEQGKLSLGKPYIYTGVDRGGYPFNILGLLQEGGGATNTVIADRRLFVLTDNQE